MKTLILKSDKDSFERFCIKQMQRKNIDTCGIYKYNSGILWNIEVMWIKILKLFLQDIWYGEWKAKISQYDLIVVFDRNLNWNIVRYLKKKNTSAYIVAWYWNPVKKPFPPKMRKYCDVWSFDQNDCKKYYFKWKRQFYFDNVKLKKAQVKYDALFVGTDKGRYNQITEIESIFLELGLKFHKHIVKDKNSGQIKDYQPYLEYDEIIDLISQSKCILDIPQKGQSGLTFRVLETLFLDKKLITNDTNIITYDFYNKQNIFILGVDDYSSLKEFIQIPYEKDDEIKTNYTFDKWIEFMV